MLKIKNKIKWSWNTMAVLAFLISLFLLIIFHYGTDKEKQVIFQEQRQWQIAVDAPEILTLRPNATGTVTSVDNTGPTLDLEHWPMVNEAVSDDDVSYVQQNTKNTTGYDLYQLPDHTSEAGTINSVTVWINVSAAKTGATAKTVIRTETIEYRSPTAFSIPSDAVYYTTSTAYTKNPNTDSAWTWAQIDALETGVEITVSNLSNTKGRCTQAWVVVDYTAAAVPTFTQNDSRWYWNADSVQPGGEMANENTTSTNATSSAIYRIRMNITVGTTDLTTSTQAFKLQYGTSTTGCPAVPSWSDVGGLASGVIWRGYDNAGTDEEATTTSTLLGSSNVKESYEEANPSVANLLAIDNGQDGEWDWVVQNNNAPGSTTYCFRMIKSNSTLLDAYNADGYPAIVTEAPSLSCSVEPSYISFGTLTTSAVSDADAATTTITAGSAVHLDIHDWGNFGDPGEPGLYNSTSGPDQIVSPNVDETATATLQGGVEGYGIIAATTTEGSGVITIAQRYNTYYLGGFDPDAVGGLMQPTSSAVTIASSSAAVTDRKIVVTHKAAISATIAPGDYKDTIVYTCALY